MTPQAEAEIDNWLRGGGLILAASDRAARALQTAFHLRRRAEGHSAWPAPNILSWATFVRAESQNRASDGRMLLNPAQERVLWAQIIASEQHLATLIEPSRLRLASMAIRAHDLLCSYTPRYLNESARTAWDHDSAAFSRWLSAFESACFQNQALSRSRAPLQLIDQLRSDPSQRPPLLLTGFDRLLPVQREILDTWGSWQQATLGDPARDIHYFAASDEQSELAACGIWSAHQLAANPNARLLVVTQQIASLRGDIERAFLRNLPSASGPLFEFSLGIPLAQVPLVRAAHSVLRWLDGVLLENEIDWLLSTGLTAASADESLALLSHMRALRRQGLACPDWTLDAFTASRSSLDPLPPSWLHRVNTARRRLTSNRRPQTPLDWAGLVPQLLEAAGLPGDRRLSSSEFQAWQRWQDALDTCASLGFDGRRTNWTEFLADLSRILDETLFAPESINAPIQITGPAESAGLTADAIWFLGATEDTWPAAGSRLPLLPASIQREFAMPHATPRADWDLAQLQTQRLLASAPVVNFSYARQSAGTETRPSRIIMQASGSSYPLPADLAPPAFPTAFTSIFPDPSQIPFTQAAIRGGANVLTSQSQCAFKAFATARLGAQAWVPAEFGLTAQHRGQLLHATLHSVWAGPPAGLRSLSDLLAVANRTAFVTTHVQQAVRHSLPAELRARLPRRYLALEEQRLIRLVSEWLDYESTRVPFTVERTEASDSITIAGIALNLRLDRIDRLTDGSILVIDYKTGDVSPKSWNLPRPDDVQLPLYAGFALGEEPAGLLFAKVRPDHSEFAGCMRNATDTLKSDLSGRSALAKSNLNSDQMNEWRTYIDQLARDFIAGRADVDPRDYPATCDQCGLYTLCRVQENQDVLISDDAEEPDDE